MPYKAEGLPNFGPDSISRAGWSPLTVGIAIGRLDQSTPKMQIIRTSPFLYLLPACALGRLGDRLGWGWRLFMSYAVQYIDRVPRCMFACACSMTRVRE
jgi:hypothetical protein